MCDTVRFSVTMDADLVKWLDAAVDAGKYGSRGQAINAMLRRVKRFEDAREDSLALMYECMEFVAEHPELLEQMKMFMSGARVLGSPPREMVPGVSGL